MQPLLKLACLVAALAVTWRLMKPGQGKVRDELLDTYDYIVVGSGSAGGILATRLSEDPDVTVALLEAGEVDTNYSPIVDTPAYVSGMAFTDADWQYPIVPQKHCCGSQKNRQCPWNKGKILGGTSCLNYMFYIRGSRHDYDWWEAHGCQGWGYDDVLPYFIKSEGNENDNLAANGYHGTRGPVKVKDVIETSSLLYKVQQELAEELGMDFGDTNGPLTYGVAGGQQNTGGGGVRQSTAHSFIRPAMTRPNFHVITGALVTKVLLEKKTAVGVKFIKAGKAKTVKANREVILSAGSIGSPQILMLSGIGPKSHLDKMGIPVVADLPVGDNLQDHLWLPSVQIKTKLPISEDIYWKTKLQYMLFGSGPLSVSTVRAPIFTKTSVRPENDSSPDSLLFLFSTLLGANRDLLEGMNRHMNLENDVKEGLFEDQLGQYGLTYFTVLALPYSKGTVRLRSRDPNTPPEIDPNYLCDERDVKILLEGIKFARKIANSEAYRTNFGAEELKPVHPRCKNHDYESDAYWECFIRENTVTTWHAVGTCKMGAENDDTAVVDPRLRVRGVKNLRVADGAIMPRIVSGTTNAPCMMIGEKAADIIKQDYKNFGRNK